MTVQELSNALGMLDPLDSNLLVKDMFGAKINDADELSGLFGFTFIRLDNTFFSPFSYTVAGVKIMLAMVISQGHAGAPALDSQNCTISSVQRAGTLFGADIPGAGYIRLNA